MRGMLTALTIGMFMLVAPGCQPQEESPAEEAAEPAGDAMEDLGDTVEEMADEAEEATEEQ